MITTNRNSKADNLKMRYVPRVANMLTVLTVGLMLAACGSTPVHESRYASVQKQIKEAEAVKSDEFAGGELYEAQKKFKDARKADKDGEREKALRLLKEAELHAQLAESQTMSARAQKVLEEVNMGLKTLQNELNR